MNKISFGFVLFLAASVAGGAANALQISPIPGQDRIKPFTYIMSAQEIQACKTACHTTYTTCDASKAGNPEAQTGCFERYRRCTKRCK